VKLIVGLGNPGREYRDTRHNVGFRVLDEIARRHQLEFGMAPAQVPETCDAVAALARYYDIPSGDLLIVVDDVDLAFGRLRARSRGSAGTHNGLRSVVERIGTEFPRLRLGVGRGDARRDLADHVLSKFEPDERAALESFIARAADAAEMFAAEGISKVMNVYNPDVAASESD
jgi:peptidyl-tRNA hydrolase, PTH1 family